MTNIIETLKADYQRFPLEQTYSIYALDVYFQDPVFKFRGLELYKWMIKFIHIFFTNLRMDLHHIEQDKNMIKTEWTLSWSASLPWKPRISISGWTQLGLNNQGLISSHIDYWHCSRLDVLKQHLFSVKKG
ncbi:DUF2358 domain-containing protein [Cylindrospermopsis raciborskii]|uniref:DUF2358 domain-containing protein n=3 Tax=Cylindrospermopsis raciborskii TaxID=77022 RepID=A0A853MFK4_9CYAN|nr:DUF2358 domain-containing protein [Cylindrospermopsis raciborskii]EFA70721.1 conserved hypothetical protein [Cylindrospermopsis raciborskii CS-505]MBA4444372.1 DUF2358 domain-containing protein [Cylindrospermopsis raciborskii CS-506_C]MBA4448590.1 DUF2358 domain-containing protein [Cylindrospermopsis raciborskii CS-506_D]MBA4455219.1 DUF2358 domain-containing protein [Cylindrospermopsis raciborskii CS-506_B]MBA4464565.1 DUF2358 domain-containing protein [Cylindrospermopsis raciborskii CS-50